MDIYNDEDLEEFIRSESRYFSEFRMINFKGINFYEDIYLLQIVDLFYQYSSNIRNSQKDIKFHIQFIECSFHKKFVIRKFLDKYLDCFFIWFTFNKFMDLVRIENMKVGILVMTYDVFFHKMDICETTFKSFTFLPAKLEGELTIYGCQFEELILKNITLGLFIKCCSFKYLSFSSSTLQKVNFFDIRSGLLEVKYCDIIDMEIEKACINNYCEIFDCKIKQFFLINFNVISQQIKLLNLNVLNMNREAARIFKNEAYKLNNIISAIEYNALEMDEYRKEVMHWRTVSTYLLLTLNKWSNNYGKSWIRGFCFTIICWLVFFIGFVVLRDVVGEHSFLSPEGYIKEAANYLWLLNGLSGLLDETVCTSWWLASLLVVVFMLGKIFIGYGIYQTVSAFRRFGK